MKDLTLMTNIEDLRQVCYRNVPKMFYEYVDTGSWTQTTYRENRTDFEPIKFKQKILVDMANRSLETQLLGKKVKFPAMTAPVGFMGMMWADGEIHMARAAQKFGIPFTLSTMSICSIEDLVEAGIEPFWFQLYVMRDREFMKDLIRRAKAAKCSALVVTVDLQVLGNRHRDIKNGLSTPPKFTIPNLINLSTKIPWGLRYLKNRRWTFRNIAGHAKNVSDLSSLSSWTKEQFDPSLQWSDIEEIKNLWGGKIILKGIMLPEDAQLAVKHGADAIIVSNHGGRQMDGTLSSIKALPDIVAAVGDKTEVWIDSGFYTGQDMLKAWAMGAKGVMLGRAPVYGLGAYGEEGVTRALQILYNEMDTTMAFAGHRDIKDVTNDILIPGTYPTPSI
ncbi:alpha-hydroxy acid oxidase [uncultured Campylobacter sp.]|uniref:alpha-hydroxy acid oxidase n=1 Tax=uncultured Campylobacter sp. TaxID=218934 RepID=UPI0026001838|nr:alpha-hydroxy acid oxidase [uncultured Campylobacter sp.]